MDFTLTRRQTLMGLGALGISTAFGSPPAPRREIWPFSIWRAMRRAISRTSVAISKMLVSISS